MKLEDAKDFCSHRNATVDQWTSREDQQERFNVCYWYWFQKKSYRVTEVGFTLQEAVAKCVDSEGDIKAGNPKTLKPPQPPKPADSGMLTCTNCQHTQQGYHGMACYSCGWIL
jgi:hypothetical protein